MKSHLVVNSGLPPEVKVSPKKAASTVNTEAAEVGFSEDSWWLEEADNVNKEEGGDEEDTFGDFI